MCGRPPRLRLASEVWDGMAILPLIHGDTAMPTYEYRCPNGHDFELFQRMSDPPEAPCPSCGEVAERQISAGAGLLFKGSGFYITDYRDSTYKDKAKAETSGGTGGAGESGSSSGTSASGKDSGGSGGDAGSASSSGGGSGSTGSSSDAGS